MNGRMIRPVVPGGENPRTSKRSAWMRVVRPMHGSGRLLVVVGRCRYRDWGVDAHGSRRYSVR